MWATVYPFDAPKKFESYQILPCLEKTSFQFISLSLCCLPPYHTHALQNSNSSLSFSEAYSISFSSISVFLLLNSGFLIICNHVGSQFHFTFSPSTLSNLRAIRTLLTTGAALSSLLWGSQSPAALGHRMH